MPVTSARIDAERDGARTTATAVDGLRDEVTVLAEQMGALGSAVGTDAWCGASADAFRGHVAELAQNATSLAQGYDDVAVALRGHAQALDALHDDVEDAERRLEEGRKERRDAEADLEDARRDLHRAQSALMSAQTQAHTAAADPTGTALASARRAVSTAHSGVTTASAAVTAASTRLTRAKTKIRKAEDDLDDAEREHKRIGDRCADEVLDARDLPFHTAAWEFIANSVKNMGSNDWTDVLNGLVMAPAAAAEKILGKADDIAAKLRELKAARKQGSPAARAEARKAYNQALREVRSLRREVGRLPFQAPGWVNRINTPLGDVSRTLRRIPGIRNLPVLGVALAVDSTRQDAEELGLAHAAAKNAASLGAGTIAASAATAAAVGVVGVGLAPVVVGVAVGTVVAAGVGYAVQEYGDDVAEAAGDALDAAGDTLGDIKDGFTGLFS